MGLGTEEPLMCSWVLSLPLCCCPQQVLGTPEDLDVPAVSGTCYCWLSPSLAGTTMAPAASEPPGHTVTAPAMPSGMGTGRVPAHSHSEEPIMNFTLRLLDGECRKTLRGETMGWVQPRPRAQPAPVRAFSWLGPGLGAPGKVAVPAGAPPCPCGGCRALRCSQSCDQYHNGVWGSALPQWVTWSLSPP